MTDCKKIKEFLREQQSLYGVPNYSNKRVQGFVKGSELFSVFYGEPERQIVKVKESLEKLEPVTAIDMIYTKVQDLQKQLTTILKPSEKQPVDQKINDLLGMIENLENNMQEGQKMRERKKSRIQETIRLHELKKKYEKQQHNRLTNKLILSRSMIFE